MNSFIYWIKKKLPGKYSQVCQSTDLRIFLQYFSSKTVERNVENDSIKLLFVALFYSNCLINSLMKFIIFLWPILSSRYLKNKYPFSFIFANL